MKHNKFGKRDNFKRGFATKSPLPKALYFKEVMHYDNGKYRLSDDREDIQIDSVESLLRSSYWASEKLKGSEPFFHHLIRRNK